MDNPSLSLLHQDDFSELLASFAGGAGTGDRLPLVVYGAADPKAGACDTLYRITADPRLNHRAQVVGGVLEDRCGAVLSAFFAAKRLAQGRQPEDE